MKKMIGLFVVFSWLVQALSAQNTVVPAELKPFIQKGYEVLDFVKNDMNGDKLDDYILLLKLQGEDTIGFENSNWDAPRSLLLIIRQPNKSLQERVSNSSLILCKQCGGMMGDPYQGITAKPGQFTVDFYGGSSWRWSESYTFRHDKLKKDWFLQTHASSSFQSRDPDNTTEESVINRDEIGDVSLQNFTPYYNADSSSWKVSAAKTYFYASPMLLSNPRTAWLIKGDTVQSFKKYKNFIQCSFTNTKEKTTTGFLLRKDLLELPPDHPSGR